MDTTVQALKNLYVALGGQLTNVAELNKIPDMINAIAGLNFGSSLPAVTTDDNNKVLTVVEGAWTKAAVPTELPSVTTDDNNKVLTVVEGAWTKAAVPTELPSVTADDNGKVLKVVEGAWDKGTDEVQSQV